MGRRSFSFFLSDIASDVLYGVENLKFRHVGHGFA